MQIIDFGGARLTWRTRTGSNGAWRILAAAHPVGRPEARYVLAPLVMAGDVYGRQRLPLVPAYSYQIAAGPARHVIWRDYGESQRDTVAANSVRFERVEIEAPVVEKTPVDLVALAAGAPHWPLTGVITASGRDGQTWSLEFPIAHVSHRGDGGRLEFQAETGPILVPEALIAIGDAIVVGGFTLAYAFFNRLDRVDLAVMRHAGTHAAMRRDYSGYVCLDGAKIAILA